MHRECDLFSEAWDDKWDDILTRDAMGVSHVSCLMFHVSCFIYADREPRSVF